jgi:hypothetical protein
VAVTPKTTPLKTRLPEFLALQQQAVRLAAVEPTLITTPDGNRALFRPRAIEAEARA